MFDIYLKIRLEKCINCVLGDEHVCGPVKTLLSQYGKVETNLKAEPWCKGLVNNRRDKFGRGYYGDETRSLLLARLLQGVASLVFIEFMSGEVPE